MGVELEEEVRRVLGRDPLEWEREYLLSAPTLQDLRMRLASYPEVHLDPSVRRAFEVAQQRRLAADALSVQTTGSPEETDQLFAATERAWERLGNDEPYWSVVTSDAFKLAEIAETRHAFYESGAREVDIYLRTLKRAGIDVGSINHLLEIGCGVGRMTHRFAEHFSTVTGVDISGPHLRLAQDALEERGLDNVEFRKVSSPRGYDAITSFDAVYSYIVLQHSPPPIIVHVLESVLGNLNPGGCAYFQIPTFIEGYTFSIEDYLRHSTGEMEMHCVPQATIFRLLKDFDVLEVVNDGTGDHRFEIMRFLARKR